MTRAQRTALLLLAAIDAGGTLTRAEAMDAIGSTDERTLRRVLADLAVVVPVQRDRDGVSIAVGGEGAGALRRRLAAEVATNCLLRASLMRARRELMGLRTAAAGRAA